MTALAKQVELTALTAAPARIYWGCHDSPIGPLLLGVTDEGLCRLEFTSGYGLAYDMAQWRREWPGTELIPNAAMSSKLACHFRSLNPQGGSAVQLALYGTEFQLKVWKALLQIEPGQAMSFSEIASLIGKPGAEKAVGLAVGSNPVPLLVPCHRVVGGDIAVHSKLPQDTKQALLALEAIGARGY